MARRGFTLPTDWPAPHDPDAADRLVERFAERGRTEVRLAGQAPMAGLLRCLGGNSPYLGDLAVRESAALRQLAAEGPDAAVAEAMATLGALSPAADRARIVAGLRRAKRVVALVTAIADIGGLWHLEAVTGALSALAEAALSLSVAHLLRGAHDAGELHLPHPDNPALDSGFAVLGMGKLGARELNFSSDVDLIVLYDPDAPVYTERTDGHAMGSFTSRLARGLVTLMEARDADGYVFRTDLRLRPDPAATPPAIAIGAAITYYESMGQNWERAAMIKARPVAGDLALGASFLEAIRPFVWRRGLDFAAVADIHAMKRRIDQHKGGALGGAADPVARIAGHNVKLGEGGIREIEFLVQTLQLVWAGRDPTLRAPTTIGGLRLLTRAGRVPRAAEPELAAAYGFLRRVEHRLQMINDRQTHELPDRPAELARVATFLGYVDAAAFASDLLAHFARVRARYAEVFELVPDLLDGAGNGAELDFRGDGPAPPDTTATLRGLGFAAPDRIVTAVRGWQAGHVRALRSLRARELITTMLPTVLGRLAAQPDPDETFVRFDRFLAGLPAGVQPLSLFQRNLGLLDRIATVLGAAPRLAEHMARSPAALEGLLTEEEPTAPVTRLRAQLKDARALEDVIDTVRHGVREVDFSISVATMEGRLDADAAGERRTGMADAALAALLGPVLADFATRYGRVRGGAMVVVAMGKAGGREMMAGSDLDLMLIYDHPDDQTESRGQRRMPISQWFVRAAHAYVAAVTAPGIDGPLYAVDMRLRPSGSKGPFAVSLSSFRRYHAESAWTWERMALTRARVVAGPVALRRKVEAAIAAAVAGASDAGAIRADARAMRARMLRELPPDGPWDVKACAGGQIEVEFVAQTLQLVHAAAMPGVCNPTTRVALRRLNQAGVLADADAAVLIRADHVWRTVQGLLRLTVGREARAELPETTQRCLIRGAIAAGLNVVDMAGLRLTLDALARDVRQVFERQIGEISG
jgi:glutamate-ammonia-ligase adenylyltransferase